MVHDAKFRILILVLIVFGLKANIANVDTAFLYGNIKAEIFMKRPPEMADDEKDEVLALNKCIYGLVQALRQYIRRLLKLCIKSVSIVEMLINGKGSCFYCNIDG